MINCTLVNNETGEVMNENYKITELEDQQRGRAFAEKKQLEEQFKSLQQEYLGYFVFFIFENLNKLTEIMTDFDLMRFLYLGTYTKKDGCLKFENGNIITKKHVKKLLKINDTSFRAFWKLMIENKLIVEGEEDKVSINLEYFYRGSEKEYRKLTDKKFGDKFTRVYIETTRDLYENTNQRSLKKLAIIYKVLPLISWQYNVLCKNPKEIDKTVIDPYTLSEMSDYLGYDKTHITRFKKDLHSLTYKGKDIFIRIGKTPDIKNDYIIVNPAFYYRGNKTEQLDYLATLFGLKHAPLPNK
ncbi:hypothetical protein [Clostridium estertheticum]|uniref:hypothetical protein n=1 Tax=Clostridium estertheticum TaxID=238834 RepID=UPI001C0D9D65|nr:hypothetical protein [Clostridium estertheticum]MBU3186672.1 hypothetical protein [Clostridium estertheticum]